MSAGTLLTVGVSWGGDRRRSKSSDERAAARHNLVDDQVIDLRESPVEVDLDDRTEPATAT
jgi:hypothetical protein